MLGSRLAQDWLETGTTLSRTAVRFALRLTTTMRVRRATLDDAKAITEVFLRARERMTYLPDLHTADEVLAHFRDEVLVRDEVWVAEREGEVLAFVAFGEEYLNHLYVHPLAQRFGIGSELLNRAKASRASGLKLWVFQKNRGARRFYETRGFSLLRLTDGRDNEEQEPDAEYQWALQRSEKALS